MNQVRTSGQRFEDDLHWVSVFLRASLASLFLIAALNKLPGGVAGTVGYYTTLFEHSLLPSFLVTAHASVISFVELVLGAWLLTGYRLELAWKVAAFALLTLAAGMVFALKYDVASANYVYLVMALAGLVTSRFDRWVLAPRGERRADGGALPQPREAAAR
jgi:hypothetical protein